jgi:hypothetical protein
MIAFIQMKHTHIAYQNSAGFRIVTLFILTVFLVAGSLSAQTDNLKEKKEKKITIKPDISLEFENRMFYDDNILKYSDKYLERFLNREDEGRFQINTYDDVIERPSIKINARQKLFKNQTTDVQFLFNRSFYLNNSIKSWSYMSMGIDQTITKKSRVNFSYSYIPHFYIRHFRDEDYVFFLGYVPEAFTPMSFSKESFDLYYQRNFLKNTTLRLTLGYTRYFHNVHYIEYDCNDFSYELRMIQPLNRKVRLTASYSFTNSKANAFDEKHESFGNSDDADASFYDNSGSASVRWTLPSYFKLNHSLNVDLSLGKKVFTTEHFVEMDQLHVGRVDYNYRASLLYRVKLSKSLSGTVFYNFLGRTTTSRSEINREFIALEKNYKQNQTGFSLIYNYKYKYPPKKTK